MELRFELSKEQQIKVAHNLDVETILGVALHSLIQNNYHEEMQQLLRIIEVVKNKSTEL